MHTEDEEYRAPALVVATGGLSIPKMGATAFGYDIGATVRAEDCGDRVPRWCRSLSPSRIA